MPKVIIWAVIDFLFSRPIFSLRQASEDLGIGFVSAQNYIVKLEKAGIVREITGYARNRIFQADEVLRNIQQ